MRQTIMLSMVDPFLTPFSDDIWGAGIYRKELSNSGQHRLRLEVLGEKNPRSKGALVHLDGLRSEPE